MVEMRGVEVGMKDVVTVTVQGSFAKAMGSNGDICYGLVRLTSVLTDLVISLFLSLSYQINL